MTTHEVEGSLIGRAARIAMVLAKYGLKERGSADLPLRERAHNLRSALEELGPTFAKLGQILSTRPDLLPPEVIDELSTLQDQVPPLTEAEVVGVMEEELGVPWEDVFESIDPQPLAAGTIGQVHRATLETGEPVVVKVQRPGARDEIMRDLGLFELFAEKAEHRAAMRRLVDIPAVIEHLSESLKRELDFRRETSRGSARCSSPTRASTSPACTNSCPRHACWCSSSSTVHRCGRRPMYRSGERPRGS